MRDPSTDVHHVARDLERSQVSTMNTFKANHSRATSVRGVMISGRGRWQVRKSHGSGVVILHMLDDCRLLFSVTPTLDPALQDATSPNSSSTQLATSSYTERDAAAPCAVTRDSNTHEQSLG